MHTGAKNTYKYIPYEMYSYNITIWIYVEPILHNAYHVKDITEDFFLEFKKKNYCTFAKMKVVSSITH
jgi:hypothetical protein